MTNKATMSSGDIYSSSKAGDFKVLNYINCESVEVEFINTGYKTTVSATQIRRGTVKDRFIPTVQGVGFLGDGDSVPMVNGKMTKAYDIWTGMIRRCYSEKAHNSNYPTYKDCTVCVEWHNFQSFAKWFDGNYIEGYELDKDIKVTGNRVYSPGTCLFVTKAENTAASSAKHYKIKSSSGNVIDIYNLEAYCRDNSLSSKMMWQVMNDRIHTYKGYTKAC